MSNTFKKIVSITASVATIMTMSGFAMFAAPMAASAVTIKDGDMIRVANTFDVYIVKLVGSKMFKRLILSPSVFNSYSHLKWSNIKTVDQATMDQYTVSTLVRAVGDPKVYALVPVPNSDSGAKDWVNISADSFTACKASNYAFDWDSIYTINTVDRDSYSPSADVTTCTIPNAPNGPVPPISTNGALSVSLAYDTPAASQVPANGSATTAVTHITYAKFNFTAPSDGSVTINSLAVRRSGVGSASDFNYLYLYDGTNRLTEGKTINTSSNKATFTNLNLLIPAGSTKTLSVVADIGANTSGVDSISIDSAADIVTNGPSVSGAFPVMGNGMSLISQSSTGYLTASAGVTPSNPSVGAQNVELAQFKLAATSEDIALKSIALYQAGSVANSNLSNFTLWDGSTQIGSAASISTNNIITFVLTSNEVITKGITKVFDVKGNVSGTARNNDTITFYFDNSDDVYGVGNTYGYGAGVVISSYDGTDTSSYTDSSHTTISGGQLTISSSGPAAANVRGTGVDFMDFSVAAGVNTEIKSLRVELYYGGVKAGATSTSGYITNVRIIDKATNSVVAGPIDLANTSSWTDVTLGSYHDFTEGIDIASGQTRSFSILADLSSSLSAGPMHVVLGSTASSYVLNTSAGAKNTDNNQWISSIVPSTYITGNTMTFTTSSLTVALGSSPAITTHAVGDTNVPALGIVLSPATNQSARVTSIKVAGFLGGSSYNNFTIAALGTAKLTDTVSSISLWDGTTQIGTTKSFDSSTGYATFDNLNVTVPSGGKVLTVEANISTNATTTGAFAIAIVAPNTDVTAYDANNNSITPSTSEINISSSAATTYVKMSTGGTLTAAIVDSDSPSATVAAGQSTYMLSTKFYGTNQGMIIDKLEVSAAGATRAGDLQSITITYPSDAAGTMQSATVNFVSTTADFTGLHIYVPQNDWSGKITLQVATNAVNSGTTSGDSVYLALSTSNFDAFDSGSGNHTVTTFSGTVSGSSNHVMILRKAVPIFTTVTSAGGAAKYGSSEVTTFTVKATSGSVAVKRIDFVSTLSDGQFGAGYAAFTASALKLYRDGTLVPSTDYRIYLLGGVATSTAADRIDSVGTGSYSTTTTSGFFLVFDKGASLGGEEVINNGDTHTYDIVGTFSNYNSAQDSMTSSILADTNSGTATTYLNSDANYYVICHSGTGSKDSVVWSDNADGASHSSVIDSTTPADWINGYKVTVQ